MPRLPLPTVCLIGLLCALMLLQGSVAAVHLLARAAHHGHAHAPHDGRHGPAAHPARAHSEHTAHGTHSHSDCGSPGHCVAAAQPALATHTPHGYGRSRHAAPVASTQHFSSATPEPPEPRPRHTA
ncbi:MAG: hypothetical protein WBK26_10525 [Burkholderiaceae bacterium]